MPIWTENFIDYANKYYAGVNRNFIKATAYWTYATAMQKRAYVRLGQSRLYPNMYLILNAPKKRGKTLLTTTAEQFVYSVLPRHAKLPTDFSDEGFDDKLGEAQGFGYLHYPELIELLAHLDKAKKAVARFNTHYDWIPMDRISHTRLGGTKIVPGGTVIAFISGITPTAFAIGMRQSILTSGGLSRFLILREDRREPLPPPPETPEDMIPLLTDALRDSLGSENEERQITIDANAREYWHYLNQTHLPEFAKLSDDPQLFDDVTGRTDHYLLKCAMVLAYQTHSTTITEDHLDKAFDDVIKPYLYSAIHVADNGVQQTEYQQTRQRVLDLVRAKRTTTAREILRALKIKNFALNEVLQTLHAECYIQVEEMGSSRKISLVQTDAHGFGVIHAPSNGTDAHHVNGHNTNGTGATHSQPTQLHS